jgi:Cysteine dioxygenase type I
MRSAMTQPDFLPPPAPHVPGQRGTVPALGLGMLDDIAAGLAASLRMEVRTEASVSNLAEGGDAFEEIEWHAGDLRRFARLLQTPAYEAWLIAWEAAADLELHDHGGSQGAFHVVKGALVEAHTDLADPLPLRTLPIGTGESRQVPATRVHRVWNPGPSRAVSVHVYSPPLRSMTFYDDRPYAFLVPLRTDAVEGAPEPGGPR